MRKSTESDLVKACLVWLRTCKPAGVWYRSNTGAFAGEYNGKKRFVRFGVPGMSDIGGVLNGRAIFIECKTATGKLSENQITFGEQVTRAGALYAVVRSLEELEAVISPRTESETRYRANWKLSLTLTTARRPNKCNGF